MLEENRNYWVNLIPRYSYSYSPGQEIPLPYGTVRFSTRSQVCY